MLKSTPESSYVIDRRTQRTLNNMHQSSLRRQQRQSSCEPSTSRHAERDQTPRECYALYA